MGLHVIRLSSALTLAIFCLFVVPISAASDRWRTILDSDPTLKRDASADSNGNPGFATPRIHGTGTAGSYDGPASVKSGISGGSRLVAIPLDSGGSIGFAGWLIYRIGQPRHIAVLSGSNGLRFVHGLIETDDRVGDSTAGNSEKQHRHTRYRYNGTALAHVRS